MLSLKQDNDRLQKMVTSKSLTSSQSSLQIISSDTIDRRLSASEVPPPSAANLGRSCSY
jgi:neuron navigator 2